MTEPATPPKDAEAKAEPDEPTMFQRARAAPITFALAAINFAVMIWAEQSGSTRDTGTLLQFGADEALHVWAGEYWRVASSMFLHVGWIHLLWNTYASVGWCTSIERVLGTKRFLLLYLLSGIGAGCVSIVGSMIFGWKVSAGASGAMFGIIGATLAIRRRQLPSFAAFAKDPGIRSTFVQIAIWTAIGLTALNMDNSAHFGGLVVGFAIVWLFTSRAARTGWMVFAVAFFALFIVAARPWWTPTGADANRLVAFSKAYFSGQALDGDSKVRPWPKDPKRAERFLEKGCTRGVASACVALADHIEGTGAPDARAKAEELRKRGRELDPGSDRQLH